ncbi:MAG: undecaprenyl/decaprenyl-phosphate alpha-N-acetylglucosaminyl 1-phosphate transferase [Oscillospiraceae bacterium]|nr:undecaprenyl/decaprenyl-phosphate alpha-N-acetylglucosaminyl 1-phosphate transferase [Oscillospiraceae bacterium]
MPFSMPEWARLLLSMALAGLVCLLFTPPVKRFAEKIGAIDQPGERRVNDHPVPRMGGLAIFLGFVASVLTFGQIDLPTTGMLIGAVIIVVMGALDDIVGLNAWVKLALQAAAALVAIRCGIVFTVISNLHSGFVQLASFLVYPLTLLWIVGCTNAVNLIDGLDGLAVGVSAISSLTMLIVSFFVAEPAVAVLLAALTGACLGFIPYNRNPAKIFMGDVGSQFLGFILATSSVMGLFKFHAIITFLVPVLAMSVPLADTVFAFFRRIFRGKNPFEADKGHFHHRLLSLGLSQKQAVAVLYSISAVLGLLAVLLAGQNAAVRIVCLALGFAISLTVWIFVVRRGPKGDAPENGEK